MAIDERVIKLVERMAAKGYFWRIEKSGKKMTFSKNGINVDVSTDMVFYNEIHIIIRNIEYSYEKAIG